MGTALFYWDFRKALLCDFILSTVPLLWYDGTRIQKRGRGFMKAIQERWQNIREGALKQHTRIPLTFLKWCLK